MYNKEKERADNSDTVRRYANKQTNEQSYDCWRTKNESKTASLVVTVGMIAKHPNSD